MYRKTDISYCCYRVSMYALASACVCVIGVFCCCLLMCACLYIHTYTDMMRASQDYGQKET